MNDETARSIGKRAARQVTELKEQCFQKATRYEVALEELAALEKDLIVELAGKIRPSKDRVKGGLVSAVETLRSEDVGLAEVSAYAQELEGLAGGLDKGDFPVSGENRTLLLHHLEDIKGRLWERAWVDVVNCECNSSPSMEKITQLNGSAPRREVQKLGNWADNECYYVDAVEGQRIALLLGPFRTLGAAEEMVEKCRTRAEELDPMSHFYSFGTVEMANGYRDGSFNTYFRPDGPWTGESLGLPVTRKRKPSVMEVDVEVWDERDRLMIAIVDKKTGDYISTWWDDDARQMFEDGFFKPGIIHGQISQSADSKLTNSVLAYAIETGILSK